MMVIEQLALEHEHQFLNLIQDFAANDQNLGEKLFGSRAWDSRAFQKFVKDCDKQRMDWRPKAKQISVTHYVLCDQDAVCGYAKLRFPLDANTEKAGGNLEFYVPPSQRGQGYGTLTLNRMLFEAVRAGLSRALVTCSAANSAAVKCIERNRGERIDSGGEIARFWIRFR